MAGGVHRQGVVVEEVNGGKEAPMLPEIYNNSTKNGRFLVLINVKITNNAVFYSKVLNKIYFQDIF